MNNSKKYKIILGLILLIFFFKGVFLAGVFPIFKGQDEARHYNTIQYLATGKYRVREQDSEIIKEQIKKDLATYHYSDEIREVALVTQNKKIRGNYYDKISFVANAEDGLGEEAFKDQQHSKIQSVYPPDVASSSFGSGGFSLYHYSLARIEKLLEGKNIFIRYYTLRILSVSLGVVFLLVAYNIFRLVNFTKKQSLILTATISFQPKLVTYFTNINYDVFLILLWSMFVLVGVIILKKGWSFTKWLILFLIFVVAIMTKPSALPLLGLGLFLVITTLYKRVIKQKFGKIIIGVVLLTIGIGSYFLLDKVGITGMFSGEFFGTLSEYLSKSLPKIYSSSRDYWGVIGWKANNLTFIYVKIIWIIEWIAWAGIIFLVIGPVFSKVFRKIFFKLQQKFFRKLIIGHHEKKGSKRWFLVTVVANIMRRSEHYLQRLDESIRQNKGLKVYVWFMLVAVIVLQIGVRVADWKVFTGTGNLALGTPGRYWLPNIVPHFVILGIGFKIVINGFAKNKVDQKRYFEFGLLFFLSIMILYWFYEVIDIIIPRFYL